MKIGFLNNQIDNRGTGNAMFDYARYNEEILNNESVIFTFPSASHNEKAVDRYVQRFEKIYSATSANLSGLDALYHIKSGREDGFRPPKGTRYLVHAVFEVEVHGDKIATISKWMSQRWSVPYVPHIVQLPDIEEDYRKLLRIPEDATVFGRHGGYDTFDISWAWSAIEEALFKREDLYFIFVNTAPVLRHERVFYFPDTADQNAKRAFINTCDAMIHARNRGETFGISVGEFSIYGKSIITYKESYEKAHLYELKGTALTYSNEYELGIILKGWTPILARGNAFYTEYTPQNVMEQFKEVFLDEV